MEWLWPDVFCKIGSLNLHNYGLHSVQFTCSYIIQCFSDVTHVLRNYLDEKGLVSIHITEGKNSDKSYYQPYEHGVAQPGVLVVKPDMSVLYSWAINPSEVSLLLVQVLSEYIITRGGCRWGAGGEGGYHPFFQADDNYVNVSRLESQS